MNRVERRVKRDCPDRDSTEITKDFGERERKREIRMRERKETGRFVREYGTLNQRGESFKRLRTLSLKEGIFLIGTKG